MSSDEESPGRAASYAARLTSFGTGGRRTSFGAKLAESIGADGGELDLSLAISKPSDLPTFNPFKVTTNAVDADLFIAAQEDPDVIANHVGLCQNLHTVVAQTMSAEILKASIAFNELSDEVHDAMSFPDSRRTSLDLMGRI